jgi:hypothetical protein
MSFARWVASEEAVGELTLTGLDEVALQRLSQLAVQHGRTAAEEAGAIIAAAIARSSQRRQMGKEEWLAMAAEARRQTGRLSVEAADLIRQDRDGR